MPRKKAADSNRGDGEAMIALPNDEDGLPGPVQWYGGKGNMVARITPLIPRTRIYCEPYGGAASILCALKPRECEVYNDLDGRLVNLFRVLQDPGKRERLADRLDCTLYALDEFRLALQILAEPGTTDDVGQAWAFFVAQNQGFSGTADTEGEWSRVFVSSRNMALNVSRWRNRVARIHDWGQRFARVQIDHRDALEMIRYWDSPDTTFYLDPPYAAQTRAKGAHAVYQHEASNSHHTALVELLLTLRGAVVLSGYQSPLYAPLHAAGWERIDMATACYAANKNRGGKNRGKGSALRTVPRTECVWRNQAAAEIAAGMRQQNLFGGEQP